MNDTTAIRLARPEDATTLSVFQVALALETEGLRLDPETCLKGVRAFFDPGSPAGRLGRYLVCEADGEIVGCLLQQSEWSDWRNGMVWWIHSVYVVPGARKRGVFRMLYQRLREMADEEGVRGLRLYVEKKNTRAQAVYSSLGMTNEHYELYEWMRI